MLGPLVVIETVLHWFQGTHFPLTASRSFFIANTGREMERKLPVVDVASILIMIAMATFFFYCGMWSIALLYMRAHDLESGLASVQTYVQLLVCCFSMLVKLKSWLMFIVSYLLYSCIVSYVDPLFLAFIPTVLLLVFILSPAANRRQAVGENGALLPTIKAALLDLASLAYDHA
ncbi:unnamed protein product [Symbiodinium natans]|uniref:Uncharacterized protein n=1 Tax=Symbiodinium natans TaxID=878477 RepID=A0A812GN39_9DINO|nr:unnamed protein product [Symbiodinium natans]